MSRPRKPTNLIALQGGFRKHPERARARANEPQPQGELGEPPACLGKAQQAVWYELSAQVPAGVLTNADRMLVEISVRLISKMRSGRATAGETSLLQSCLSRMGLTPADRSRVSTSVSDKPRNAFAEL
jgi:hypothetical protein